MQIGFSGLVTVSLKPEVSCDISNSENDTTHKPSVTIQKRLLGYLVWQTYIYVYIENAALLRNFGKDSFEIIYDYIMPCKSHIM